MTLGSDCSVTPAVESKKANLIAYIYTLIYIGSSFSDNIALFVKAKTHCRGVLFQLHEKICQRCG